MKRYLKYFIYVLKHKWFVLTASFKINAPIWNAIIHDLSKFRPSEFFPYAYTFYHKDGSKRYKGFKGNLKFSYAWNKHQKRNKHHYQYWMIVWDNGRIDCLPMPYKYILEMIADWMGAGRVITGKWEVKKWYQINKNDIKLNVETRKIVEKILEKVK